MKEVLDFELMRQLAQEHGLDQVLDKIRKVRRRLSYRMWRNCGRLQEVMCTSKLQ